MEETVVFGTGIGKKAFGCMVLGILGLLMVFFLGTNQGIYIVGGEYVGKYIFSIFEKEDVVFDGMERGKRKTQDNWDLILEEILPPAQPVSDRLLTEIPIPEEPAFLPDVPIDRSKPGVQPVLPESAVSGNAEIEGSIEQGMSGNPDKAVPIIPEVPNERSPVESITPAVPDEPIVPVVPEEPVAPAAPDEPIVPVVPEEPVTPAVPDEPIVPVVPDEPVAPAVPDKPIIPVVPGEPVAPVVPDEPITPVIPVEPIIPEPDPSMPGAEEKSNACFLLDEAGILTGFRPEYAVIERGCLSLPETCTGVRKGVFSGCGAGIKEIYIPDGTLYIEEGAFAGLQELEWIEVDWRNPAYLGEEGVLFDSSRSLLLAFPNGRTETYLIPAGVTRIASGAFAETALSRLDARDCGVLQFGEAIFGSSNGNGIRITVPWGTRAAYEAALAGYAVVITE